MQNEKTAIVTGATKGIGLAISRDLLSKNYFVIMNYANDIENAKQVEKEFSQNYKNQFAIIKQNLEHENDIEEFYNQCRKIINARNGIDILILNSACTDRTEWKNLSWSQWQHVMDVNVNAPAGLIRKFDAELNNNGSIIMIGAIMGIYPHAISIPYTVSKAALNALTIALVKEYCERNIRVNAVLPGFVETEWQKNKPEAQKKRICSKIALQRFAQPEEISQVVMSVIDSTYINGALIPCDGSYCYK